MTENPVSIVTSALNTAEKGLNLATLLLGPRYTKKQHKAVMEVLDERADYIREHPEFELEFNDFHVNMKISKPIDFSNDIRFRKYIEEIVQDINFQCVLENSKEQLKIDGEEIDVSKIDLSWYLKFKNIAETMTTEDLQMLWGRILSNEVQSPGLYSLRFLNFLMNISSREANVIQKISQIVIEGDFVNSDEILLNMYCVSEEDVDLLKEIGILGYDLIVKPFQTRSNKCNIYFRNFCAVVDVTDESKKDSNISFEGYMLTSIGKQIIELFTNDLDESSVINYMRYLKNIITNINFTVYKTSKPEGYSITQLGEIVKVEL